MENKKKILDVQNVRIADVFVVAPFLIYTATMKHSPKWVRASLLFLGLATLGYNGYHFIEEQKRRKLSDNSPDNTGLETKKE